MSVENGNADALACDRDSFSGNDHAVFDVTENAKRFLLALLFFSADVRDDIAVHLGPVLEGLSGAGDGLVGRYDCLIGLKLFPGCQSGRIALDGAVGLDRDKSAGSAQSLLLVFDDGGVLGVDLRDDHGNIRGPAVGAVVGNDRRLCFGILFFNGTDRVLGHVNRAEAEIHLGGDRFDILDILYNDLPDGFGDGCIHLPSSLDTFFVGLACASRAGRDRSDLEPGVILQKGDESLADHSGSAKDTCAKFLVHFKILLKQVVFHVLTQVGSLPPL